MDNGNDVNFEDLEEELRSAIAQDNLYLMRNAAKFRAVDQRVSTYDEFREIVNAAHLIPIEKRNQMQQKPKTIWNPLSSSTKKKNNGNNFIKPANIRVITLTDNKFKMPKNQHEFCEAWHKSCGTDAERFLLLKKLGHDRISKLFQTEVGFDMFAEMILALMEHKDTVEDFVMVVRTLEALVSTKRFALTLQFLSSCNKANCRCLFQLLRAQMADKLQDLADSDITEWTMQELMKKFEMST